LAIFASLLRSGLSRIGTSMMLSSWCGSPAPNNHALQARASYMRAIGLGVLFFCVAMAVIGMLALALYAMAVAVRGTCS
jgi:hypothetical protein